MCQIKDNYNWNNDLSQYPTEDELIILYDFISNM